MIDFKFNGTESFSDFFEKVRAGIIKDGSIVADENSYKINLAGFAKDEIKVKFNKATGELTVVCNGNSPIYGKEYAVSLDLDSSDVPSIEYVNGVLVITPKQSKNEEPDEIELDFDTRLLD